MHYDASAKSLKKANNLLLLTLAACALWLGVQGAVKGEYDLLALLRVNYFNAARPLESLLALLALVTGGVAVGRAAAAAVEGSSATEALTLVALAVVLTNDKVNDVVDPAVKMVGLDKKTAEKLEGMALAYLMARLV